MKGFSIIVATDAEGGIGKGDKIPWRISLDMQHFKRITMAERSPGLANVVVMGRNTWESLPEKFRPLPGRVNAVITSKKSYNLPEAVFKFSDLESALDFFCNEKANCYGDVFIIGGGMVYASAIGHRLCQKIHLTRLDSRFSCDTFFPDIPDCFQEFSRSDECEEAGTRFVFVDLQANPIGVN